jgi:hypothetical protein
MTITDTGRFLNVFFNDEKINIYPVIADNSATLPFAVYQRTATAHSHKDQQLDQATYSISIFSAQYMQSMELLNKIIEKAAKNWYYDDKIIRLNIDSTSEDFADNYVQNIIITVEIN